MSATPPARPVATHQPLLGLLPFMRPYRRRAWLALLALTVAAVSTLVLPMAFRVLIDQGFPAAMPVTSTSTF
jgi:ATP-binding cassette subfamily B protein